MAQSHSPSVKKPKSSSVSAKMVFNVLAEHGYEKVQAEKVMKQIDVRTEDGQYGTKFVARLEQPKSAFRKTVRKTRGKHGHDVKTSITGRSVHMRSADGQVEVHVPAKGMVSVFALDKIQKLTGLTFTNGG